MERSLPAAIDEEISLCGACLIGTEADLLPVWSIVTEHDFSDPRHAAIYRAAHTASIRQRNRGYDGTIVLGLLRDAEGDSSATLTYAAECADQCPSGANAIYYARAVAEKARVRRLIVALQESVHRCLTSHEPANDICSFVIDTVTKAARVEGNATATKLSDAEVEIIKSLGERERDTYPTGMSIIDDAFGGIPKQGVVTLMGYPSSGKTTLALGVACNLALGVQGRSLPVRVFSYEQPAPRIAATLLSSESGVNIHSLLNTGRLPAEGEWTAITDAADRHGPLDFQIIDQSLDAVSIFREIQAANAKHGRGVAVVDYIQNLPAVAGSAAQDDMARIGDAMRWLQRTARDCGWLVIVVSQVAKAAQKANQRPRAADALGSSAIEQASDMMLTVWREHQGEPKALASDPTAWLSRQRKTELSVVKNKYGQLGVALASFDAGAMRFRAPTAEEEYSWE